MYLLSLSVPFDAALVMSGCLVLVTKRVEPEVGGVVCGVISKHVTATFCCIPSVTGSAKS